MVINLHNPHMLARTWNVYLVISYIILAEVIIGIVTFGDGFIVN